MLKMIIFAATLYKNNYTIYYSHMKNIPLLNLPMVALLGVTCLGTSVADAQTSGRAQMAEDYATVINSKANLAVTDETRQMDRNNDDKNTVGDVSALLSSSFDVVDNNSNVGVENLVADAPARVAAAAEDAYFVGKLSGNNLTVSTAGAASFIALQLDVTLPATVKAATLTKAAAINDMIVASNLIGESGAAKTFRVLGYTLTNQEFNFTEATELFTAALTSEASIAIADVAMTNVITVDKDNVANDVTQTGTIESGAKRGDVNGDGNVDALDLSKVVEYIMDNQYVSIADVNNDNLVDALDLSSIVNIIMQ